MVGPGRHLASLRHCAPGPCSALMDVGDDNDSSAVLLLTLHQCSTQYERRLCSYVQPWESEGGQVGALPP